MTETYLASRRFSADEMQSECASFSSQDASNTATYFALCGKPCGRLWMTFEHVAAQACVFGGVCRKNTTCCAQQWKLQTGWLQTVSCLTALLLHSSPASCKGLERDQVGKRRCYRWWFTGSSVGRVGPEEPEQSKTM